MAATEVIRVDEELVRAAKDTGGLLGRSAAGQISHWARLGRAIENADVPSSAIQAVLTRQAEFDSLSEDEQRAVTALWSIEMQERIANLDLVSEFEATGAAHAYLDDDGELIEVPRTRPTEPTKGAPTPATAGGARTKAKTSKAMSNKRVTKPHATATRTNKGASVRLPKTKPDQAARSAGR